MRVRYFAKELIVVASFIIFGYFDAVGQSMSIKSVSLQPDDKTAIIHPCLDNGQDTCALLKIKTDYLEGIQFPNNNQFIKASYSKGIYSVYMPANLRKLDITHKDYIPIQLDMEKYGYKRLRKGKTYLVVLETPKIYDLQSSLIMKVEPKQSTIIFDDQEYTPSINGTIELSISPGNHSYMVSSSDYFSKNGTIIIGKREAKTMTVSLKPIMHEVIVRSNVDKARVYVDNIDYGREGELMLPQGRHNIRVQADGFVDAEKNVLISSSTAPLSFILKENAKVTHIHATPVTIYSGYTKSVYKNNKKIKNWYTGATIMFMPGEYLLSDDKGNTKKIFVGTEPLIVYL